MKCSRETQISMALSCVFFFDAVVSQPTNRPKFIECADSEECAPGECCVLGMSRYSIPSCKPYPLEGEFCWPPATGPFNVTLTYPSAITISFINIHSMACPCVDDLQCGREASCIDPTLQIKSNNLNF